MGYDKPLSPSKDECREATLTHVVDGSLIRIVFGWDAIAPILSDESVDVWIPMVNRPTVVSRSPEQRPLVEHGRHESTPTSSSQSTVIQT